MKIAIKAGLSLLEAAPPDPGGIKGFLIVIKLRSVQQHLHFQSSLRHSLVKGLVINFDSDMVQINL